MSCVTLYVWHKISLCTNSTLLQIMFEILRGIGIRNFYQLAMDQYISEVATNYLNV